VLAERGETAAPEAVGDIAHQLIPGPAGNQILLRILTPEGDGPFPVIVYYHGGGWVIAGPDAYEASARALTNAANAVVVMVAYRQSPESRFPAAVEDSYAAYLWVTENVESINGNADQIAVVGESAGGNLATVVSLLARENGDPLPVHQVLVYPVAQLVSADTPSALTYADAAPLNRAMLGWFKERYLPDPSAAMNGLVSPLLVEDLSGLPPATVILAEIDPLLSEGIAYASRLEEAGVDVVWEEYAGVTHEFFGMGAVLPEAQDAVALAAERLQESFGTGDATDTGTGTISGSDTLTDTGEITDTTELTGTSDLTDTETLTGTDAVTTTGQ
jgi:acetyl esterase